MPATYPSLRIIEGFQQTPRDGRTIDHSADGLARVRIAHADRFEFVVPHGVLSASDLSTLRTFYTTNRALEFYFTSPEDGVQYTVIFASRPAYVTDGYGIAATSRLLQSS